MNILASFEWIKEYVDLEGVTPEQVASRLSLSGPGVERLYPQGTEWDRIVIGHVTTVEAHPQADKLRITSVDVGSKTLRIVCGGSNVKVDQWVVVAMLGARVKWHGEGELVELKPIEIRGAASEGMICAANEVGLFDAFPHGEAEILDVGEVFPERAFIAGQPLAAFLEVQKDTVLDIEVTTNRPDAMCMQGLAREIAVVLDRPFKPVVPMPIEEGEKTLNVSINTEDCQRFMAVRVDGVTVAHSPWWLKRRLLSAGIRPINTLVDIGNYVMLELGQPMHAYDADKVNGSLTAKKAEAGQAMKALDGKTYDLDTTMLVIADEEKPVAIAGIMGGEETAITLETTSVVFEAATFNEVNIRRTSRKLHLTSESQSLFEKGLSTEALPIALARAVELCLTLAGGRVVTNIADQQTLPYKAVARAMHVEKINELIFGKQDSETLSKNTISSEDMEAILTRLGFEPVGTKNGVLSACVPWWRAHDIEADRDLVEEIARIYGYVNIPPHFPAGISGSTRDPSLVFEDRLKTLLKGLGFTELMSYSFVSRELLERAQINPEVCLRVQNPLSNDFEYMRPSLMPSLIQAVSENQERFPRQYVFELSNVYQQKKGDLPAEQPELVLGLTGASDAWNRLKGRVEAIFRECGIQVDAWRRLENDPWWHPGRSMQAMVNGNVLATVGEWHPRLAERWKLNAPLAVAQMRVADLLAVTQFSKTYKPLPLFPESTRDLALVVDEALTIETVQRVIEEANEPLLRDVAWFDVYRGQGVAPGRKSLAFHLVFSHPERTLETAEVDTAFARIRRLCVEQLNAGER